MVMDMAVGAAFCWFVGSEDRVDPLSVRERVRKCDLNGLDGGDGNFMLLMLMLLLLLLLFDDVLENSHCVTGESLLSGRGGVVVVVVDTVDAVDLVGVAGTSDGNEGEGSFSSRGSDLSCRILGSLPAIFGDGPIAFPGMGAAPSGFTCETLAKCGINGQLAPFGGDNDDCRCCCC